MCRGESGLKGGRAWLIDGSGRIESQAGREQVAARDRFDRPDRYKEVLRSTMPCSVRVSMNAQSRVVSEGRSRLIAAAPTACCVLCRVDERRRKR